MRTTPYRFIAHPTNGVTDVENTENEDMETTEQKPETPVTEKTAEAKPETAAPPQQPAPVVEKTWLQKYGWLLAIVIILAALIFFWKFKIVSKAAALIPAV
jgi:carbohydrate-binding DOMON domain-containing protein